MIDPSKYRVQYSWVTSRVGVWTSVHSATKSARAYDLIAVRGGVLDVIAHELECPFGDASRSIMALDDLSEWKRGDSGELVIGEIVLKLLSCHEHGV
jgi:hypothetical protein